MSAKNVLIATGSEPTPFPNLPFDEKVVISSTGALSLGQIPKELVVIGGGVIGVEMASVYSRLGTKVTIVEYMDKLCPFLDDDIADSFKKVLTKQGLKVLTGHKVTGGKNNGNSGEVTIEPVKGGDSQVLKADHILIATGRRPYSEGLGAKEIGVKFDEHSRVVIDGKFKTSVDGVYAVGDIVAGPMLAHKYSRVAPIR